MLLPPPPSPFLYKFESVCSNWYVDRYKSAGAIDPHARDEAVIHKVTGAEFIAVSLCAR